MPLHADTPLLQSRPLSLATGRTVWLKLDALQPSGSFKIRGMGAACEHYAAEGKRRFITSSAGNAGLAVAYAGRQLGIPVTVVVPETASQHARSLLAQEDAEVIVHGAAWAQANERALSLLDEHTALIHPFDDPVAWSGHATLIDEVAATGTAFDSVILSVGGGGLLAGILEGLARNGLAHLPVIAVETRGADSLAQSLAAGENRTLPAITSIATSLGASRVADHAFQLARACPLRSAVVTDGEALDACLAFLHDHRLLVEPACGAALAMLYSPARRALLDGLATPLVVVCGGATATYETITAWKAAADHEAAA